MNPPIFPIEITAVVLAEMLFGLAFNRLVEWVHLHKLWDVSLSVVMGVAATVIIPAAFWWKETLAFWQAAGLLTMCFAASGAPIIIGSLRRNVAESHKRRPWPTAAAQARDAAVMDLNLLADRIANKEIAEAQMVNSLHRIIGILVSV